MGCGASTSNTTAEQPTSKSGAQSGGATTTSNSNNNNAQPTPSTTTPAGSSTTNTATSNSNNAAAPTSTSPAGTTSATNSQSKAQPATTPGAAPAAPSSSSSTTPQQQSSESKTQPSQQEKAGPKIIIQGPPACGKGAHCAFLVQEYGVVHISTGDVMREEVKKGTENGAEIKKRVEEGQEIDDDLLVSVVASKLLKDEDIRRKGWLLDGFPRSAEQASKLVAAGVKCDHFLLLHLPDEELVDRVANRRLDPETGAVYHLTKNPPPEDEAIKARLIQRADDTPEKIQARIDMFNKTIEAIRPFYDNIHKIDGNLEGDELKKVLRESLKR